MRFVLITILSVLFLDQWLKLWIKANYAINDLIADWGLIKIQFIENKGMAFGMAFGGDAGKLVLTLFRVVAVVVIAFVIRNLIHNKAHKGLVFCVSLIFAGALGNIIDSAFYGWMFTDSWGRVAEFMPEQGYAAVMMGSVVDMIHAEFYYPTWAPFGLAGEEVFPAIFNLADMAISTGVIAMLVFNKKFFGKGKGDFAIFKKQTPESDVNADQ